MGKKRKLNSDDSGPKKKLKRKVIEMDVEPSPLTVETPEEPEINSPVEELEDESVEMRNAVRSQNRKKKSGGFQSMGLSFPIFKGIMKKGYKVPTPIQRKTIPLIMDGKDVVAMARTGSGKTAAFLIPMFEKLKAHSSVGVRALILSPTRELSLQTLKFMKELGKFTGLKAAAILGGDSMDDQFAAIHENPDLIIATPGRLMHIMVEMNLKLQSVEYIVFDEADRLFEMGFEDQLHAILARLPESRQTVLFSATLPKLLVDFARAGLHDPTLIRLDVDTKLSDQLKLAFFQCRSDDKMAVLLHLLTNVVQSTQQAIVFVATKHHVEFLNLILTEAGINCSYSYSALDPTARKISVAKFRNKMTRVLIVTDLAARGIDIPLLDVVINYNFPAKPKLFIHRVGRVARAGRSGVAYSLISPDEIAYVIDLHLFLGRPLTFATSAHKDKDADGLYGLVLQRVMDEQEEKLRVWRQKADIEMMSRVVNNAYKQYIKSRPAPANESTKRAKTFVEINIAVHPMFGAANSETEADQTKLLESMKTYRPQTTIFEINSTSRTHAFSVMKQKRAQHEDVINRRHSIAAAALTGSGGGDTESGGQSVGDNTTITTVTETDVNNAFSSVFAPKSKSDPYEEMERRAERKALKLKNKKRRAGGIDEKNFLPYRPKDYQSEQGLGLVTSNFDKDASNAVLDFTGDDDREMRKSKGRMVWDRKRKKYVQETGLDKGGRKLMTESGRKISSSYKTNVYEEWLDKNKMKKSGDNDSESEEETNGGSWNRGKRFGGGASRGRGGGYRGRGGSRDGDDQSGYRGHSRGGGFRGRGGSRDGDDQSGYRGHSRGGGFRGRGGSRDGDDQSGYRGHSRGGGFRGRGGSRGGDDESGYRGRSRGRGGFSTDRGGRRGGQNDGNDGKRRFRTELKDKSHIVKQRTKRAEKQAFQEQRRKHGKGGGAGGGRGGGGRGNSSRGGSSRGGFSGRRGRK